MCLNVYCVIAHKKCQSKSRREQYAAASFEIDVLLLLIISTYTRVPMIFDVF